MKRYPNGAIGRARYLRREMTFPEKVLWKALRRPDLGFRREAPIGPYVADFVHLRARLVVELDAGWHDLPERELQDARRDAWLSSEGYRVARFRNQQVLDDPWAVVSAIRTLLPQGEKGRNEGVRAAIAEGEGEAPPALIYQRSALTLTQPSPREGEGFGRAS